MRMRPVLVSLVALAAVYIGLLFYLDLRKHLFADAIDAGGLVLTIALISLVAFTLRYARWNWLLRRGRHGTRWFAGYLAYLAGFALTALPGKSGELVRVRYFAALRVPARQIVACFFFERVLDVITVFILASLIGGTVSSFWLATAFAAAVVVAIIAACRFATIWRRAAHALRRRGWHRPAAVVWISGQGIAGLAAYLNATDIAISLTLGLGAFGIQSASFVYLTSRLGFDPGYVTGIAIFPLATLLGAATMIPGGIGTTEAAIILILHQFGAPIDVAVAAAIAMRIGTLWFGIALGVVASITLESLPRSASLLQPIGRRPRDSAQPER